MQTDFQISWKLTSSVFLEILQIFTEYAFCRIPANSYLQKTGTYVDTVSLYL